MKLTMVIPTYNEAENLSKLSEALFRLPIDNLNVLVVDDCSPDGTGEIADGLAREYSGRFSVLHRVGKRGLGTAYMDGFKRAILERADVIGQMDADFSHPIDKISPMLSALDHCDAVIGSRYIEGGSVDRNWPAWRKGLSAFGNFYARTILSLPVRDATGGFRLWRRETLMQMPLDMVRTNGYAFQVEIAYMAHRLGFSFKEIPIYFADRRWGTSKMSFRIQREAAIQVWQMLLRYRALNKEAVSPLHCVKHH